jgi:hypothetical protein
MDSPELEWFDVRLTAEPESLVEPKWSENEAEAVLEAEWSENEAEATAEALDEAGESPQAETEAEWSENEEETLDPEWSEGGVDTFEPELEALEEAFRVSPGFDPQAYEQLAEEQAPAGGAAAAAAGCYVVTKASVPPAIGFEFDLSYGASSEFPPPPNPDYSLEGKKITTHSEGADGFRLKGDGNRIEIGTKPFELNDAGKAEMEKVMKAVMAWVDLTVTRCKAVEPDTTLGYASKVGPPRAFVPTDLDPAAKCMFPLGFSSKVPPYYRGNCSVAASPQATLTLPLARIDDLVARIKKSETDPKTAKIPGRSWSGPSTDRMGDRSKALYEARDAVNASRASHVGKTTLKDGTPVTTANYTATLQGLLILLVSYLRSSELVYSDKDDWEDFAKGYLPLNVKNPFRLLLADLTAAEKAVFRGLYTGPRTKLWQLARPRATLDDGKRILFPKKSHVHQKQHFDPLPTWNDLVDSMLANAPFTRTVDGRKCKPREHLGCELLMAACSSIIPHQPGSRRVTVEMRRIGFNWVFSHAGTFAGVKQPGWVAMTKELFAMARDLNQ